MAKAKKTQTDDVALLNYSEASARFRVVGTSPLIMHAMSAKTKMSLLLPRRKTAADKAEAKHNPIQEFRDSMYFTRSPDEPTLVYMPAVAFKAAARAASYDFGGPAKALIGRLMHVVGSEVHIYGTPEVLMSVTRSADMNKTPDVRTRAVFPAWCAEFTVRWVEPRLNGTVIAQMLSAAGITQGVGDWRPEKGSGNFGCFELVEGDDPRFGVIQECGGRAAQLDAIKKPVAFDSETESLLSWYDTEVTRRGIKPAPPAEVAE